MKVRSGFVSNSSSSSFLIYGTVLDSDDIVELLRPQAEKGKLVDYDKKPVSVEDLQEMEFHELLEYLELPKGMEAEVPAYSDMAYVGASWDTVKDNETGKEFKDRVYESLKGAGLDIKKGDLGTHSEAWHD